MVVGGEDLDFLLLVPGGKLSSPRLALTSAMVELSLKASVPSILRSLKSLMFSTVLSFSAKAWAISAYPASMMLCMPLTTESPSSRTDLSFWARMADSCSWA